MSNEEVIQMVLSTGKCHLENPFKPSDPIAYMFEICQFCWQEPSLRPTMEEILVMLKDPSQCKRKKRTSSLMRQHRVSLPPSNLKVVKSVTTPISPPHESAPSQQPLKSTTTPTAPPHAPATSQPQQPLKSVAPPHGHTPSPQVSAASTPGEDTLKRRPAPKRPAPVKPAPKPPQQQQQQQHPQAAGKSAEPSPQVSTAQADGGKFGSLKRPAPVKPPSTTKETRGKSKFESSPTVVKNVGALQEFEKTTKEQSHDSGVPSMGRVVVQPPPPPLSQSEELSQVVPQDNSLDDDDFDTSMFVGGAESVPDKGNSDDFILEPPEEFSDASLGELDDPNDLTDLVTPQKAPSKSKKDSSKKQSRPQAMQFSNPVALEAERELNNSRKVDKRSSYRDEPKPATLASMSYKSAKRLSSSMDPLAPPSSHKHKSSDAPSKYAEHTRPLSQTYESSERPLSSEKHKKSSHSHRRSRTDLQSEDAADPEAAKARKAKKKKRSSREYSGEVREGHAHKHKSKKKRKSASSDDLLAKDDDVQFPEYEFDRGADRIPVAAKKEVRGDTLPRDFGGRGLRQMRQASSTVSIGADESNQPKQASSSSTSHDPYDTRSRKPEAKVTSRDTTDAFSRQAMSKSVPTKHHSSYEDVVAGDEYTPPWLDEPVDQSQDLSFEELDAYYEPEDLREDTDAPKVVFKEDVAALIW